MIIWYFIAPILVAIGIWSLLPSESLRELRRLAIEFDRPDLSKSWGHYQTTRKFVSPQLIVKNIMTSIPPFEPADLSLLNTLFAKLGKPPAEFIEPERFAPLPSPDEAEFEDAAGANTITHVAALRQAGVRWRQEVLRKAEVEGCTADYVALLRAAESSSIAREFLNSLNNSLSNTIQLKSSAVVNFLDLKGLRTSADELFRVLVDNHPMGDFYLETVGNGDRFVQKKMRVDGTVQPGQYCQVIAATHQGLCRKSDPDWRIPAFVKIRNTDVNERG